MPIQLRDLGATLPLPDPESLRLLARHELLSAWFQRRLLEELAAIELPPEAEADPALPAVVDPNAQLLAYAGRCGLDSLDDLEIWHRARGLSLDEVEKLVRGIGARQMALGFGAVALCPLSCGAARALWRVPCPPPVA